MRSTIHEALPRTLGRAARSRLGAVAVGALCALRAVPAWAQAQPRAAADAAPAEVTGTVLAIEEGDLIIDLGADRGLADGATVELWRPLHLKHPVTGQTFVDRFRIGTLTLTQVRRALSLATPDGALAREPQKGDVVVVPGRVPAAAPSSPAAAAVPPPPTAQAPAPAGAPPDRADLEARAIAAMLESLRGADLSTRIRRYEDYVRAQPNGRFSRVLGEEAAALRKLIELDRAGAQAPRSSDRSEPRAFAVRHQVPVEAREGAPLRLAVELPPDAAGAVLHARHRGRPAFVSMPMAPAGPGYFAAEVPPSELVGPAREYFIEAATRARAAGPVVGSSELPEKVEVRPVWRPPGAKKLDATVHAWTDYADYNRLRGNDRVWQTEGYFGLRFGDTGVRALRSGFGVYRGLGGTLEELDELELDGRKVGLTYGYLEVEVGATAEVSVIGRVAVGLLDDGVSGGGQALVRIGNDKRTNLVLGGELLGGVGLRSIVELNLATFDRFPILLRTEVTNQPAGASPSTDQGPGVATGEAEIGARGIAQLGFRPIRPLVLSLRGSVQGRNIRHAGPGFGGGVSYEW